MIENCLEQKIGCIEPSLEQYDEEEQGSLVVKTQDEVDEVIRTLLKEQQEMQQALKQMNEALMKQEEAHRDETRALEMKTNQHDHDIAKLRRLVTGKASRNRRGYSFFLNAAGGGKGNTDDSGEYMLEEDIFSLMMLNKYFGVYPCVLHKIVQYCIQALCLGISIFFIIVARGFSLHPIVIIFWIFIIILSRKIAILCKRILFKVGMSAPWALGMATFAVFQMGLGIAIIYDQWINTRDKCDEKTGGDNCVPFGIPTSVGPGVTFARYVTVLLVLATQTDILTSIQTILLLRNAKGVPWDKVIGEEGNRTWRLWIFRILLPNVLRFIQAVVILFASFIVIVQTETIIDLLKDSTALLFVSQSDNIMFEIADMGYLGDHLAQKTAEVKATRWTVAPEANKSNDEAGTHGHLSRLHQWMSYFFNIRVFILCFLSSLMIVGLSVIVAGQFDGKWIKMKYPDCNAKYPLWIGDGYCNDSPPYNSEQCGFDGGDCVPKPVNNYPGCMVHSPERVGDGRCHDYPPYNSEQCGFDGEDCLLKPVDGYQGCMVQYPARIGNEYCNDYPPYNSEQCGFDGGDCIPKPVDGYPNCNLLPQYHDSIGNGRCFDRPPSNSEQCGFDGGDCIPKPVDGYPNCNLLPENHDSIGNGRCFDHPPYNSEVCGFDGGDCVPKPVDGYDGCMVHWPERIGDGHCHDYPPYNSEQCGFDGGDCIPKPVDGYDGCMVHTPRRIGDEYCTDFPPYNTEACGWDGGDCPPPPPS